MGKLAEPWNRTCPDCSTTFSSVQQKGICPTCSLVFDANSDGSTIRRRHRLGNPTPQKLTQNGEGVKHARKMLRFLNSNKIKLDEFNFNLLLYFVELPRGCWHDCAAEFSCDLTKQFIDYLDGHLIPVDYMPSPNCFMVGPFTPDRTRRKQMELKPIYLAIHEFWKSRSDTIAG